MGSTPKSRRRPDYANGSFLVMFALAGVLAMMIAHFTTGFQSVKAALTSPVNSLRSE